MKNNLLIFGDSYSTFEGHVPAGYAVYYSDTLHPLSGITKVEQTWWHQVMTERNMNLVRNDSWSGSTVCYNGYCSHDAAFIHRLHKLIDSGFFRQNPIDTVFVFGGTNDSWADAPLGELKFDRFTKEDLSCALSGISCFLKTL